jgi:hypothetical protein
MGLAIVLGMLADQAENDPEGLEYYRGVFAVVNELLNKSGLPTHSEPEALPFLKSRSSVDSYPYSFIHYLRRAYAHRVADPSWVATPFPADDEPMKDPVLNRVANQLTSHLLCHSDAEGFYVPVDFQPVLFDETEEMPGGMLGSSYRLRDELIYLAPALGIRLDGSQLADSDAEEINVEEDQEEGVWRERLVWLSLFEAARLSIEHGTAICFS